MITEERVRETLKQVIDPELGIDIVNLGLIYKIEVASNHVNVDMTLTTPGCPLSGSLPLAAERVLHRLEGLESAKVNLVWQPAWTPQMMTPTGRAQLGRR